MESGDDFSLEIQCSIWIPRPNSLKLITLLNLFVFSFESVGFD